MDHLGFWSTFPGRIGAPIFSGTLVGCLLDGNLIPLHGVLMVVGVALMALGHWREFHTVVTVPD
jgi:uncharacterized membrane protein YgdD (TMEM256/DUF423 family)